MTVTEQHNEESTQSARRQSADHANPITRRVRPLALYFRGRPAQSWVDALGRGRITLTP